MIDTVPPAGHHRRLLSIALRDDGGFELTVGTAEFGNGTSTVHRQIAATALATTVDQIRLKQSDTAHGGHDTGAYGCGRHLRRRTGDARSRQKIWRPTMKAFAASAMGVDADACVLADDELVVRQRAAALCLDRADCARARHDRFRRTAIPAARRARSPSTCRAFASP